jgi:hypothetical protein
MHQYNPTQYIQFLIASQCVILVRIIPITFQMQSIMPHERITHLFSTEFDIGRADLKNSKYLETKTKTRHVVSSAEYAVCRQGTSNVHPRPTVLHERSADYNMLIDLTFSFRTRPTTFQTDKQSSCYRQNNECTF